VGVGGEGGVGRIILAIVKVFVALTIVWWVYGVLI